MEALIGQPPSIMEALIGQPPTNVSIVTAIHSKHACHLVSAPGDLTPTGREGCGMQPVVKVKGKAVQTTMLMHFMGLNMVCSNLEMR